MIFLRKRRRLSLNDCHNVFVLVLASLCVLPSPVHSKFRICGFRLTMTMTALCKNQLCGGYFVPTKKRSSPLTLPTSFSTSNAFDEFATENFYERRRRRISNEDDSDDYAADDGDLGGYGSDEHHPDNHNGQELRVSKRFNMAHGQMYGKRSGIANECCEKRCSLAYLRTYCCSSFQINTPSDSGGGQAAAPHERGAFSYSAAPPLPLSDPVGAPLKHKSSSVIGALAKLGGANRATAPKGVGMSKVKQAMLAAAKLQPTMPISQNSNIATKEWPTDELLDDEGEDLNDEILEIQDSAAANAIAAQKRKQQTPRRYEDNFQRESRFP